MFKVLVKKIFEFFRLYGCFRVFVKMISECFWVIDV